MPKVWRPDPDEGIETYDSSGPALFVILLVVVTMGIMIWGTVTMPESEEEPTDTTVSNAELLWADFEANSVLGNVTLPDGRVIECLFYAEDQGDNVSRLENDEIVTCNWNSK